MASIEQRQPARPAESVITNKSSPNRTEIGVEVGPVESRAGIATESKKAAKKRLKQAKSKAGSTKNSCGLETSDAISKDTTNLNELPDHSLAGVEEPTGETSQAERRPSDLNGRLEQEVYDLFQIQYDDSDNDKQEVITDSVESEEQKSKISPHKQVSTADTYQNFQPNQASSQLTGNQVLSSKEINYYATNNGDFVLPESKLLRFPNGKILPDNPTTVKKGVLWQHQSPAKFHQRLFNKWAKRYFILTLDYLNCFKRAAIKVGRSEMGKFLYKVSKQAQADAS